MSSRQDALNALENELTKHSLKLKDQLQGQLLAAIEDLTRKKIVTERDAWRMKTKTWQDAALNNWMKEPQYSSRCPDCQIDIVGPRTMMHYHLKWHESKRTERREGDNWTKDFRIHF